MESLRPPSFCLSCGCTPCWTHRAPTQQRPTTQQASGQDWVGYGRNFNQQRFSSLTQINADHVKRLGLMSSLDIDVWNVSTVPLTHNGVIYLAAGYSIVHAVDAVSGKLLWKFDAKATGPKTRLARGICGLAL